MPTINDVNTRCILFRRPVIPVLAVLIYLDELARVGEVSFEDKVSILAMATMLSVANIER